MESRSPVFEVISAEPESPITLGVLTPEPPFPSRRIILFFSLLLSLIFHLMLLNWRL